MTYRSVLSTARNGNNVLLRIDTLLSVDRPLYTLSVGCGGEISAALLENHIHKTFGDLVRAAREEAYASGYSDGRGHRERQTYQPSRLGRDL